MKTLSRQEIFNGVIIKVVKDDVELASGIKTSREVVYHREAVAVAAVNENDEILMVTQYRYAIGRDMLELPAGLIDEGESPLEAAKRELLEETGYEAANWKPLAQIHTSPGSHNEKLHIFSASGLTRISDQSLDEDEIVAFSSVPFEEVLDMVTTGKITDAKTIIGVLLHYMHSQGNA